MTWLSPRTLHTLSQLQRQYAMSCLDPTVTLSSSPDTTSLDTAYTSPRCRLLYADMHSPDAVRSFKATQAWSMAHFMYHTHLADGACTTDANGTMMEWEVARALLGKEGMLGVDEVKRQFEWNERLVHGVGWVWLVHPYASAGTQTTHPKTKLRVIRVQAGKPPTVCPETGQPCLPILGVDLWEHAYVPDFGADRSAYLRAWWQRVRWERVVPALVSASSVGEGVGLVRVPESLSARYAN